MSDFEVAIDRAIETVMIAPVVPVVPIPPAVQLLPGRGIAEWALDHCHFHFCECVVRRIRSLGLIPYYVQDDSQLKVLVRSLFGLAFLNPLPVAAVLPPAGQVPIVGLSDVRLAYQSLQGDADYAALVAALPPAFLTFMTYFTDNWMTTDAQIRSFNVYHLDDHRTNNDLEGWHLRFLTLLRNQYGFWAFIKSIQNEQRATEIVVAQSNAGQRIVRLPSRKIRAREAAMANMKELYLQGQMTRTVYLNNIVHYMPH
jgi:hypothetical protein